jgi:hypothetical protein
MTKYLLLLLLVLIFAWYLSFSASRLDRLHHRVETSWEHLDALLQRRAALALEIAHQSELDPALDMLLTASAYESREAPMADRNEAESLLSESLKIIRESASAGEISIKIAFIDRLSDITEKIRVAISIHLEAVAAVENLRSKAIFKLFHLAGRAKLPFHYSFEEDAL